MSCSIGWLRWEGRSGRLGERSGIVCTITIVRGINKQSTGQENVHEPPSTIFHSVQHMGIMNVKRSRSHAKWVHQILAKDCIRHFCLSCNHRNPDSKLPSPTEQKHHSQRRRPLKNIDQPTELRSSSSPPILKQAPQSTRESAPPQRQQQQRSKCCSGLSRLPSRPS